MTEIKDEKNIDNKVIIKSETLPEKEAYQKQSFDTELDVSNKDKKTLGIDICTDIDDSITESAEFFNKLAEWDGLYEGDVGTKTSPWPGCANTNVGIATSRLDGIVNKIVSTITETDPVAMVRSDKLDDEKIEAVELLIQQKLDDDIDFKMNLELILHNAGKQRSGMSMLRRVKNITRRRGVEIYRDEDTGKKNMFNFPVINTALSQFKAVYPSAEKAKVSTEEYAKIIKNLKKNGYEKIQIEYDHVIEKNELDIINRQDYILCPAGARKQKEAKGEFMRVWLTEQDFLKGIKDGTYKEEDIDVLKQKIGKFEDKQTTPGSTSQNDSVEEDATGINPLGKEGRECFTGIYQYDINDDDIKENVLVTVDYKTKIVLRLVAYPNWSNESFFYQVKLKSKPVRFDGIGIIERLAPIQYEINIQHNQRIDCWTQILKKVYLKDGNAQLDPDPADGSGVTPGDVITVEGVPLDRALIELIEMPKNIPSFISEEEMLIKFGDELVGWVSMMSGRESSVDPDAPASKTIALLREANVHIAAYIKHTREGLNRLLTGILWLEYQYGPDQYEINGITLNKEDINPDDMNIDLRVSDASMSRALKQQEAMFIAQLVMQFPLVQQNMFGQQELVSNILKEYRYGGDREAISMTPEQIEQRLIQAMEQAKAQQEQQAQEEISQAADKQAAKMEPGEVDRTMEEMAVGQ